MAGRKRELEIGHLYPGLMNLYGDRGNIIAMKHRASLRGIQVKVTALNPGSVVDRGRYHLFFLGGGQDAEQSIIYKDFIETKGAALSEELKQGAACLAVCGGYQLLGNWYEIRGGHRIDGIGFLDVITRSGRWRTIGNILIRSRLGDRETELVGFENHGGRTFLREEVVPLGEVIAGGGNNGEDGGEGALFRSTVGTYLHGPVLPKNPVLTDFLIEKGLQREDPAFVLPEMEACFEKRAFESARAITLAEQGKKRERF